MPLTTVTATFVDHDSVARTVDELHCVGLTQTEVIPLADVDPPLAEPVLVAVRVDERHAEPVREFLRLRGGALREERVVGAP